MKKIYKENHEAKMSIIEHLVELRERILIAFLVFFIITILCLIYSKDLTVILQAPASGIKFLQLAPGEYFFVSIKIALYSGIILSSPFSIYQIIRFIMPGLTEREGQYIIPILITSIILFFTGILFSYKILIPMTLKFLIKYGSDIVEPIWSLEEYFNFISLVLFSTGLSFQIPILQILLGLIKIVRWEQMIKYWKNIVFLSTIVGAIITPSTDPLTQILMTTTIMILYLSGILALKVINK
uniref:Sec-independent protein translocase component TatC n=1 Tax=Ophidocladus simpliciusculus TaxID=1261574 RepID=A0A1Z1MJK7_9FLOR|nr:Sec-independent protein translocase component TatC [Ophidocladus simpliciusculus]ARW66005.1 Sec-independent protein translocase component TatC [Ophidocladus simpliciusculus]